MKAEDLALYALIRRRNYELLKPDLIDFFTDPIRKKILEACFHSRFLKADLDVDIIKNWISRNTARQEQKSYLDAVEEITVGEKYIDITEIERNLEREYYNYQWSKINNVLTNSKATLEMQKDIIRKTNEVINRTKRIDDYASIKQALTKSHEMNLEGKKSDLYNKSIEITDSKLINIFGKSIYPLLHVILARPNSYKTTLLYNLIHEFSKLDKYGIIVSTEDVLEMIAIKIFSIVAGFNKPELLAGNYAKSEYEKHLAELKDNIFVMDTLRTPNEMYVDLRNKLSTLDVNYIAVDYIQGAKRERFQTETEKAEQMVDVLFELNKEFKVPIFQLSQAPKQNVQQKTNLGLGTEKGSSVISEKARWACSLNSEGSDDEDYDTIIAEVYKTTMSSKGQRKITFHKKTGKLVEAVVLDG
jgi:hypothetical protein